MDDDELKTALYFWVDQASTAVHGISLIESYEEIRKDYVRWCADSALEPAHLAYIQTARAVLPMLDLATDSLLLFCTRADEDCSTSNVKTLKNAVLRRLPAKSPKRKKLLADAAAWTDLYTPLKKDFTAYRIGVVAHSDKDWVLGHATTTLKPLDIIGVAAMVVGLIELAVNASGLKPVSAVKNPAVSDSRLVVLQRKSARISCDEFWRRMFSIWDERWIP